MLTGSSTFTSGKNLSSAGVSALGDGISRAALPLVAIALSTAPWAVGLLQAIARLPWLVASLPAGAAADSLGFRPVARIGLGCKVLGVGLIAVALASSNYWIALPGAFLMVAGEVAFETATQVSIQSMHTPHSRASANGRLYAWQVSTGQFLGPAAGSFLFAVTPLLAPASSAVTHFVAAAIRRGRVPPNESRSELNKVSRFRSVIVGFPVLFSSTELAITTVIGTISMMAYALWSSIFIFYVTGQNALDLPEWTYGLLLAVPAIGTVPISICAAWILRRFTGLGCIVLMFVGQTGLFAPAIFKSGTPVVVAGLVAYGIGIAAWNGGILTYRQSVVEPAIYGRVTSAYRLLSWGATPLGAAGGALLVSVGSLSLAFLVGLLLVLLQLMLLPGVFKLHGFRGHPGEAAEAS